MSKKVVCVWEVVWDIFPDKKTLWWAPLNVAYHLSSFLDDVKFISKVWSDELWEETIKQIWSLWLNTDHIQIHPEKETWKVKIDIKWNTHSFEIAEESAWDHLDEIEIEDDFVLVYWTLFQRNKKSKKALEKLIKKARKRFYDVNLRWKHTKKEIVIESLHISNIAKLNDEELIIISNWLSINWDEKELANQIRKKFDLEVLIVTKWDKGAFILDSQEIFYHEWYKVEVEDTVWSWDAFFATFIEWYLNNRAFENILKRANKVASYVATKKWATPDIKRIIKEFDW